jgi:general stress protein CsbA
MSNGDDRALTRIAYAVITVAFFLATMVVLVIASSFTSDGLSIYWYIGGSVFSVILSLGAIGYLNRNNRH